MKPRISMVSLAVKDVQLATNFYENGLGFPKVPFDSENVAFFNLNGTWLGLSEREMLAEDAGLSSKGSGFSGMNLPHNVHSEEEVTSMINQALAAGATLVKPAQKAAWGGFHGYFSDLDGHLWEIAFNPFAWVGPEDPAEEITK